MSGLGKEHTTSYSTFAAFMFIHYTEFFSKFEINYIYLPDGVVPRRGNYDDNIEWVQFHHYMIKKTAILKYLPEERIINNHWASIDDIMVWIMDNPEQFEMLIL